MNRIVITGYQTDTFYSVANSYLKFDTEVVSLNGAVMVPKIQQYRIFATVLLATVGIVSIIEKGPFLNQLSAKNPVLFLQAGNYQILYYLKCTITKAAVKYYQTPKPYHF